MDRSDCKQTCGPLYLDKATQSKKTVPVIVSEGGVSSTVLLLVIQTYG